MKCFAINYLLKYFCYKPSLKTYQNTQQQFLKDFGTFIKVYLYLYYYKIPSMEELKTIARYNYQGQKHHRQILRSILDPKMIEEIELSQNPSLNYKRAYHALFEDELTKSVHDQEYKKIIKKAEDDYSKIIYSQGIQNNNNNRYTISHSYQEPKAKNNKPNNLKQIKQTLQNNGRFIDYFEKRDEKFQNLINKQFDGGQSFYKNHDNYIKKKNEQMKTTSNALNDQIYWKDLCKNMEKDKKAIETNSYHQLKNMQRIFDEEKKKIFRDSKQNYKNSIIQQIQQEKQRKNKKSYFNYQNQTKHNPITNPIQYHIDNPYILKKIQDKKKSLHA